MRLPTVILGVLFPCSIAYATSYLFTLQQKVAACKAVMRVSLIDVQPPLVTNRFTADRVCICKAKVLEVLKGPKDVKEINFQFHPYDSIKLPAAGQECFVFLHELQGVYWVFEGPDGIRAVALRYFENRISQNGEVTTETFSHSNFVAAIRTFASQPEAKKQ